MRAPYSRRGGRRLQLTDVRLLVVHVVELLHLALGIALLVARTVVDDALHDRLEPQRVRGADAPQDALLARHGEAVGVAARRLALVVLEQYLTKGSGGTDVLAAILLRNF